MHLKSIKLTNFRCHKATKLDFHKGVNILLGKNAVGKTSVVEAISYLSVGKSHKTNTDQEIIQFNSSYTMIDALLEQEGGNTNLFVAITPEGKRIKRDGKVLKTISEHVGFLNSVVFSPEDVSLLVKSPSERRRFLDVGISQIDKEYLIKLSNYKKLLKQRNELLKMQEVENFVDKTLLQVITNELAKQAQGIIKKREQFIGELNSYVLEAGKKVSNGNEDFKIIYIPNSRSEELNKRYEERLNYDLFQKTTSVGPHRDDFMIVESDKNIATYGSQGQIRTAALSLKLGLSEYYASKGIEMIVILDDVFSELDKTRQNKLLETLKDNNQVFITTTSIDDIDELLIRNSNIIMVEKGEWVRWVIIKLMKLMIVVISPY